MPNLAWWQEGHIDNYLDAFRELKGLDRDAVRRQRRDKFLAIGRGLS